jgi:hypothetical protein
MTASAPIPEEGELRLGTVELPAGRWLRSNGGEGEPVAWMTQAQLPEPGPVWSALAALHGQTGLVPILEPAGWGGLDYLYGETAAVAEVDQVDAALPVAAEHWVFCDEPAGRQSVRTTAADIIGAPSCDRRGHHRRPSWYFWWD